MKYSTVNATNPNRYKMYKYIQKNGAVNSISISGFCAPRLGMQNSNDITKAASQFRRKTSRRRKKKKKISSAAEKDEDA